MAPSQTSLLFSSAKRATGPEGKLEVQTIGSENKTARTGTRYHHPSVGLSGRAPDDDDETGQMSTLSRVSDLRSDLQIPTNPPALLKGPLRRKSSNPLPQILSMNIARLSLLFACVCLYLSNCSNHVYLYKKRKKKEKEKKASQPAVPGHNAQQPDSVLLISVKGLSHRVICHPPDCSFPDLEPKEKPILNE